jgi:hypothetical protein
MRARALFGFAPLLLVGSMAVGRSPAPSGSPSTIGPLPSTEAVARVPAATASAPPAPAYPWLPRSTDRLDVRFTAPQDFTRVRVDDGSFGAFLRALPLLPRGSPVVDYRGRVVREGDDPNIAAVVDIDVGQADLQQCADAVVRMNAEWQYGHGDRDVSYRVGGGTDLSYAAYLAGKRAFARGNQLIVDPSAGHVADDHRVFRAYLDEVFTWINTTSLERDGLAVPFADVSAGDYFVMKGAPFGHAVLVLDVARSPSGSVALLLGQSYMPAQSFQVLGAFRHGAWFVVPPGAREVVTPFWRPFPLTALRRLP